MNAPEVVRADPRRQRHALIILVGGLTTAAVIIGWGLPWLERWVVDAYVAGNFAVKRWICIGAGAGILALGLGVVGSGVNMLRIGGQVLKQGRFPPAGLRVLFDTPVQTGRRAVGTGRVQQVLGGFLIAIAFVLVVMGAYVVLMLWPTGGA